jgi:type I restriction enzyme S subunit
MVGDVLIAKDGNSALDTVCEVKQLSEVVLLSSVAILRPRYDRITSGFLRYYLESPLTRAYLKGAFITGAAIPRVILDDFRRARIVVPPLSTQRKIVGILAAYDQLVENINARIAILGEMSQALFREWFVRFCFPGHENVPFVPSSLGDIPQGWKVRPLNELCSRITDGSHRSPSSVKGGLPMASMKDMTDWGLNLSACRYISAEDFDDLVRNDCKPKVGDVLIAKDGASYLKYIFVVEKALEVVVLSSIAILRPNERIEPHLLTFILKAPSIKARLANYVTGAAIPRVILKDFARFQIAVPPRSIQTAWWEMCQPIVGLIHRLRDKSATLRKTRDLLLPKLISGQLDVEHLDIDVGEPATASELAK